MDGQPGQRHASTHTHSKISEEAWKHPSLGSEKENAFENISEALGPLETEEGQNRQAEGSLVRKEPGVGGGEDPNRSVACSWRKLVMRAMVYLSTHTQPTPLQKAGFKIGAAHRVASCLYSCR